MASTAYLTTRYFAADNVEGKLRDYYETASADRRKTLRNEMVGSMMYLIDVEYSKYADDVLYSSKALIDSSLGIVGLGLTAGAAVTGHAATAQLLAGIATAVQGSRELIDKNVYLQRTIPTVVAAMDAGRAEQYGSILRGLKKSADAYPLAEALRDVAEYYHRGTMVRAFANISDVVGVEKEKAETRVNMLRSPGPVRRDI
ncbi:MAG: hypothetical protein ABIP94_19195 [Planctomycetota bacterium]